MMIKSLLGASAIAIAVLSAPVSAGVFTIRYSGANDIGPSPLESATLKLTTEDVVNQFGGYFITSITGNVDGDVITGLLPFEGPDVCGCFPDGFATLGGWLSITNTLYLSSGPYNGNQLFDYGGIGFRSATNYYNLYGFLDNGGYGMLSVPTSSVIDINSPDLPDGFSASSGIAAIPEPASWAMLISGFGIVGASLRRNRRAALAHA